MLKRGLVVSSLLAALLYFVPSSADAKITNEPISGLKRIVVTATPSPTATPSAGSEEVAELGALVEEKKIKFADFDKGCEYNQFGAHLMLQDYDDLRQIEVQLDKVLELTGECGFVKGFDPYVRNDYKKWGAFVAEAAKRSC